MEARYAALRRATEEVAAVDAHAHNLVEHGSAFPFLRGFSEAEGDALALAPHSLSFKRSLRDIAALYNCEASLEKVEKFRSAEGLKSIGSKCFQAANISVILIDDGIAFDKMLDLESHKAFAPVVGRVLRIERLAETIINDESFSGSSWTLDSFTESYIAKLNSVSNQIVALKSIAAYRSGLEINPNVSKTDAEDGLRKELTGPRPFRITNKNLIDYLFTCTLGIAVSLNLPVQIHTGFGDKDLDLRKCNPLHLRAVLEDERFAKCQIVLLHASYPFSKEASYLASVYSQVYLDFGLAIPKLSVHGMTSSLKELLELAPIKKVMFSTDGYAFPETYYLGAKRARDVVYRVLSAACEDGDLSIQEAIEAVEDIFRRNALHLYKLNVVNGSINHETTIVADSVSLSSVEEDVLFVRIIWSDASGQYRCRVVPAGRFYEITRNKGVGLTFAAMGMTSFCDGPADGSNLTGVGEIRLVPDMPTLVRIPWSRREEMVMADMQIRPGEGWEYCPRNALRKVTKVLLDEFNVTMKAGFENEFFLRRKLVSDGVEQWVPYDNTNYCSTSAFDGASSILQEVYSSLKASGIVVEQLHAEAGKGQFEIALKYILCTLAADNLIYARETIKSIARKHGLLATFLPKPDLNDLGSGSHVHLSLWENDQNVFMGSSKDNFHGMSKTGAQFLAGVYHHLPSILAFTAPHPNSYDRIQPDTWSGAYQCWGKENREAPLRTACPPGVPLDLVSNFEIKSFDGCANPHLGLAAIIAAGIDGLRRDLKLPEPIESNPSDHASKLKRLPQNLQESVEALSADKVLHELISDKLVTAAIAIRKAEINHFTKNPGAFNDLIFRY
uniref:Glutamine synthetase n=1 Tax=Saccharum hybrid cultivar ROC22 TaxID=676074 RepID=A0A291ID23_9POAL|nr:glutamine synthetase [Saccharum hybrid cultivar ROC22]